MKKFITQYKVNGTKYGSHIYARTLSDAEVIANKRGDYYLTELGKTISL